MFPHDLKLLLNNYLFWKTAQVSFLLRTSYLPISNSTYQPRMSTKPSLASNNPFRTDTTIEMQKTGSQQMPADYRDPNHPLAPSDLETQSITRHGCANKKTLYTIAGVATLVVGLVTAFLVSIKISHNRSIPSSNCENATNTNFDWQRATTTTTLISIGTETPQPSTLTTWVTVTPIIFAPPSSTPLSTGTASRSAPANSTQNAEPPPSTIQPAIGTDKPAAKCLVVDTFGAQDICEYHCIPVNEGKAQHCELRSGRLLCIQCDSV
ncbi:uncharacterized protein CC84DRAFT_1180741 [Paraphaeosphaeria sporulosa]|uniref:Uncharacterized protein n=1 Tax=Paraphaeosphaeria sporulosa TaxID=1460663 RepID=A0A177BZ86_9PLEO|nr:uncharacterized protein CC84DRAFT_1180741 [Paraphaeosphaeria sporulosa]OAF99891.1 hypothetical protein CC84DRAFT_1180741 [Paraphaeosphaeria sporulosa]